MIESKILGSHYRLLTNIQFNHGLILKVPSTITLKSITTVSENLHEATMLKAIFSKSVQNETTDSALEIANLMLMNRVAQVIQSTARAQEKFSTLTHLRPLNS